MRHRTRLCPPLLLSALPLALSTACGGDGGNAPTPEGVVRVEIQPGPAMLVFLGERHQLTAMARDAEGVVLRDVSIGWSSSDTAIAIVDATGMVTARRDGQASVTATAGAASGRVTISVDVGQAASRCVNCHDPASGHNFVMFAGATCPTCHLPAFLSSIGNAHEVPLPGHPVVARGFALVGVHDTLPCTGCHQPSGPRFRPADATDCFACHEADYQGRHGGSNFPRTCLICHSTDSFRGATYDHESGTAKFRLIGVHATLPCSSCHSPSGAPLFTPRDQNDCVTCHQADYQQKHAGSGYPTTCLTCHTTTAFRGARFSHDGDFFPIYSGTHRNKWASCATCHLEQADFSRFSCFSCHNHSQSAMDNEHRGRTGYRYASDACLTCHPRP